MLKGPDDIDTVEGVEEEDKKEPRWVHVEADGVDETLLGHNWIAHDAYPKDVKQCVCPKVVVSWGVEDVAGNHVAHTEGHTPYGPQEGTQW